MNPNEDTNTNQVPIPPNPAAPSTPEPQVNPLTPISDATPIQPNSQPAPANPFTSTPTPETSPVTPSPDTAPQSAPSTKTETASQPSSERKTGAKKFIIIGIIAFVAIALIVLGFIFIPKLFKSKESALANEIFSEKTLIAVKQGDKYGYIDLNGKMVIQPTFTNASDFQGEYAVAKIKTDNSNKNVIINRKGEVLIEADSDKSISYDAENKLWIVGKQLYDDKLNKLLKDGEEIFTKDDGYYLVIESGREYGKPAKHAFYNKAGKRVYEFNSTASYFDVTDYGEELGQTYVILSTGENTYDIINADTGKVVIQNLESDSAWGDEYTEFCLYDGNRCAKSILVWNDKVVKEYNYDTELVHWGDWETGYFHIYSNNDSAIDEYFSLKTGQLSDDTPDTSKNPSDKETPDLSEWELATGNTIMTCSAGYGLMFEKSQTVPCEYRKIQLPDMMTYEYLKSNGKNYVIGNKSEKSYLLQANNGKVVTEFNAPSLEFETLSSFIGTSESGNGGSTYHVYNLVTGKSSDIAGTDISYYPMYFKVDKADGSTEYYNKNLQLFYTRASEE